MFLDSLYLSKYFLSLLIIYDPSDLGYKLRCSSYEAPNIDIALSFIVFALGIGSNPPNAGTPHESHF